MLDERVGPFHELLAIVSPLGGDTLEGSAGKPVGDVAHCNKLNELKNKTKQNSAKHMRATHRKVRCRPSSGRVGRQGRILEGHRRRD